jgi:hypothetical protein
MRDLFAIYFTGMVGISKAVPVGVALKAPLHCVFLMTVLGAYTSAVVIYLGHGWVEKLVGRHANGNRMNRRRRKICMLVSRYGVAGMGLIGTVTMGSNLTFLLGLTVVDRKKALAVWVAAGIPLWAAVLTVIGYLGSGFAARTRLFHWLAVWSNVLGTRGG